MIGRSILSGAMRMRVAIRSPGVGREVGRADDPPPADAVGTVEAVGDADASPDPEGEAGAPAEGIGGSVISGSSVSSTIASSLGKAVTPGTASTGVEKERTPA